MCHSSVDKTGPTLLTKCVRQVFEQCPIIVILNIYI